MSLCASLFFKTLTLKAKIGEGHGLNSNIYFANKPSFCSVGFHVGDIAAKRIGYMHSVLLEEENDLKKIISQQSSHIVVEVLSGERGAEDKNRDVASSMAARH